jgi:hypothetical protein
MDITDSIQMSHAGAMLHYDKAPGCMAVGGFVLVLDLIPNLYSLVPIPNPQHPIPCP